MPEPTLELADIFRQHGPAYRQAHSLPLHQHRLMQAIETCRTAVLGGSVEWCDHCQYTHTRYRSFFLLAQVRQVSHPPLFQVPPHRQRQQSRRRAIGTKAGSCICCPPQATIAF